MIIKYTKNGVLSWQKRIDVAGIVSANTVDLSQYVENGGVTAVDVEHEQGHANHFL